MITGRHLLAAFLVLVVVAGTIGGLSAWLIVQQITSRITTDDGQPIFTTVERVTVEENTALTDTAARILERLIVLRTKDGDRVGLTVPVTDDGISVGPRSTRDVHVLSEDGTSLVPLRVLRDVPELGIAFYTQETRTAAVSFIDPTRRVPGVRVGSIFPSITFDEGVLLDGTLSTVAFASPENHRAFPLLERVVHTTFSLSGAPSGAPIFTTGGDLVGIVLRDPQPVILPAAAIERMLQDVLAHGEAFPSVVPASYAFVRDDTGTTSPIRIRVERVVRNSPWGDAGARANDRIIRINGQDVTFDTSLWSDALSAFRSEEALKLDVLRGDDELQLEISFASS